LRHLYILSKCRCNKEPTPRVSQCKLLNLGKLSGFETLVLAVYNLPMKNTNLQQILNKIFNLEQTINTINTKIKSYFCNLKLTLALSAFLNVLIKRDKTGPPDLCCKCRLTEKWCRWVTPWSSRWSSRSLSWWTKR
jgi:hypothetical protein